MGKLRSVIKYIRMQISFPLAQNATLYPVSTVPYSAPKFTHAAVIHASKWPSWEHGNSRDGGIYCSNERPKKRKVLSQEYLAFVG